MLNKNKESKLIISVVKLLRFPFSFHLLPVFLFSLSQAVTVNWNSVVLGFFILHLIVYPSSNAYNSYQDQDESSIGGIKNPPKATKALFFITIIFDLLGILIGLFISYTFCMFIFIYILISHIYSYRKLRLKKYPIIGFITVFVFQGGYTFLMSSSCFGEFSILSFFTNYNIMCMLISSLFIGSVYPLTQIYQHDSDKKDGVISISYKLGYIGTFIFSSILFSIATIMLFYYFDLRHQRVFALFFSFAMLPIILKLTNWFSLVRKSNKNADFENTMKMNWLASSCMNAYFLILVMNSQFAWF